MARQKSKGSIILEILIVILIAALLATILYPKKVWKEEEKNTKTCRSNMDRILKAELVYQKFNNTYSDSLEGLISFIKNDSTKAAIKDYIYADTALAENIIDFLTESDSGAAKILDNLYADTLMFAIIETINYDSNLARVILNRLEKTALADSVTAKRETDSSDVFILKQLRNQVTAFEIYHPIKDDDSLFLVFNRMMPEISTGSIVDTLYASNEQWAHKIDSSVFYTLDHLLNCPSMFRAYKLTLIDTSEVFKYIEIECPVDSLDIENVKKDFVKYNLGHLRLENHGKIDGNGEKSWL